MVPLSELHELLVAQKLEHRLKNCSLNIALFMPQCAPAAAPAATNRTAWVLLLLEEAVLQSRDSIRKIGGDLRAAGNVMN
jgi:hypothetical protein